MFMKRKLKSDRGFTLAELLIVVAIIGVLVAIAIPIFTSQLERSREAVDLSDVRSAYAEVMMAAITGDTSATYTKDSGQKIYKETDGTYSIMVTPLKQQKDDWQTPLPITIGGVSSNAGDTYWKGIPGPKGYCEITYHPLTSTGNEYVSFYWTGGTDNGNNPTLTPVPTQPIFPTETPTPTIPDNTITDVDSVVNKWGSYNWPSEPASGAGTTIKIDLDYGQLISYHDSNNNVKYYVVANENGYKGRELGSSQDQGHYYWTPDGANGDLIAITKNPPHTWKNAINGVIYNLSKGDIYIDPQGYTYVYKATSTNQSVPNGVGNSQWVKVLDNKN